MQFPALEKDGLLRSRFLYLSFCGISFLGFLLQPNELGIGATAWILLWGLLFYTTTSVRRLSLSILVVLAAMISTIVWMRSNFETLAFSYGFSLTITILLGFIATRHDKASLFDFFALPVTGAITLTQNTSFFIPDLIRLLKNAIPRNVQRLFPKKLSERDSQTIFAGLIVGIPLALIILLLFYVADESFAKFTDWIFLKIHELILAITAINFSWERVALWFGISPVIVFTLLPLKKGTVAPGETLIRSGDRSVISGLIISLPILLFSILKITSLPTYIELFHQGSINPSTTIRESFFILALIAAIGVVSLLDIIFSQESSKKLQSLRKFVSFALQMGLFFVILDSYARLATYISLHGLTIARYFGGVSISSVFAVLVLFSFALMFKNVHSRLLRELSALGWIAIVGSIIFVFCFGILNMESFIIRHKPTVNGQVDWNYLTVNLTPDAVFSLEPQARVAVNNLEACLSDSQACSHTTHDDAALLHFIIGLLQHNLNEYLLHYTIRPEAIHAELEGRCDVFNSHPEGFSTYSFRRNRLNRLCQLGLEVAPTLQKYQDTRPVENI